MKNIIKKLALLTLISLTTSLFSFYVPVFAEEEKDLIKIYNSEPTGQGEMVYVINACDKRKSYAPLRCSKELYAQDNSLYAQCREGEKYKEGKPIINCIMQEDRGEMIDPESGMPKTYPGGIADCKDTPEEQGYDYVPEWAIVGSTTDVDKGEDVSILGTIAWPSNAGPIPMSLRKKIVSDGGKAVQLYRANLCVKWDVLEKDAKSRKADQSSISELTGELKDLYSSINGLEFNLIEAGCNNSNSEQDIEGLDRSTDFNDYPSLSCTIKERISGTSGIDIIAKYVHAIYVWASSLVGIVCVFTMVYSGIEISMAGGDSAKYESAKNRIMKSIMGLAILFLSGLILYTINPGFFVG